MSPTGATTLTPPSGVTVSVALPEGWRVHDLQRADPFGPPDPTPVRTAIRRRRAARLREAGVVVLASTVVEGSAAATMTISLRRAPETTDHAMLLASMAVSGPGTAVVDGPRAVDLPLGPAVHSRTELPVDGDRSMVRDRFAAIVDGLVVVADFTTSDRARVARWAEAFSAVAATIELKDADQ